MPSAVVNNIKIHYRIRGNGPPLLMIMGWTANLDWWPEALLKALERHYTLILYDNRGAGRSESSPGHYSMAQFGDDGIGLADALGFKQVHVFGVSMGGMIAQELALNHPARVDRLIIGCSACSWRHGQWISIKGLCLSFLYGLRFPLDLDKWLISLTLSRVSLNNDKARDFIRRISIAQISQVEKLKQFRAIQTFDTYSRLNALTCPVLLLAGTRDLLIPHRNSDIMKRRIPDAKLVKFPGLSHAFIGDDPDAVFHVIHDFLKRSITYE